MPKNIQKPALEGKIREENLESSHSVLVVSVGQDYFEGGDLEIIFNLIKQKLGMVTILLADVLQRFNDSISSLDCFPDIFFQSSHEKGLQWIERNKKAVQILGKQFSGFIHWKEFLFKKGSEFSVYSSEYEEKKSFIDSLYEKNTDFKNAVDFSVENYLKRKKRDNSERTRDLTLGYLKEECAVVLLLAEVGLSFNFLLYPKHKLNNAVRFILKNIIHMEQSKPNILQILEVVMTPQTKVLEIERPLSPKILSSSSFLSKDTLFPVNEGVSFFSGNKAPSEKYRQLVYSQLELMLLNSDFLGKEKNEFFEIIQNWLALKTEIELKQKNILGEAGLKKTFDFTI